MPAVSFHAVRSSEQNQKDSAKSQIYLLSHCKHIWSEKVNPIACGMERVEVQHAEL